MTVSPVITSDKKTANMKQNDNLWKNMKHETNYNKKCACSLSCVWVIVCVCVASVCDRHAYVYACCERV